MKDLMKRFTVIFIFCILLIPSKGSAKPAMRASQRVDSTIVDGALIKEAPKESADSLAAKGDKILDYYEKLNETRREDRYLISAKYFFYQASRVDIANKNAFIGRARVALFQDNVRDAKNNLFMALNFDENNPKVNFYIGEAFFQDGEFAEAIKYYTEAYTHGYKVDYKTNLKLGICYEKMDDEKRARYYYQNAIKIIPTQAEARNRLQGLDVINTSYEDYEVFKKDTEDGEPLDPEDLKGLPTN